MKNVMCIPAWIILTSFWLATKADTKPATVRNDREIADLIRDLGSERFPVREAAMRQLMERDDALPAVYKAAQSPDAEVAKRARTVVQHLEKRTRIQRLRQVLALAERGELDRMIDGLYDSPCAADDREYWSGALQAIWGIADRVRQNGAPTLKELPFSNWTADEFVDYWLKDAKYSKFEQPPPRDAELRGLIRTPGYLPRRMPPRRCIILSNGAVESQHGWSDSIVLVNGPLKLRGIISDSIFVCDGDPDFDGGATRSIILVRGTATKWRGAIHSCLVVSMGKPKFSPARAINCIGVDSKSLHREVLHWFEPADVGLQVGAAREGVVVTKVTSGMPPEKAGIQKGDLITAIDGKKVESEDTFRVLLRRGSVRPSCHLTIRRGDMTLEPFVEFWETLPKE